MKFRWASKPTVVTKRQPTIGPWHAVSVTVKAECCDEARSLRHLRFLSRDAPSLPLPSCSMAGGCSCTYRHHADRRGAPRREEERVGLRRSYAPSERRSGQDRRSTDF